jgi:transposase
MEIKNKYYKHSRLSETKFRELIRCFALDLSATESAALTSISCRAVNTIYLKLRHRIAAYCEQTWNPQPGSDQQHQQRMLDELGTRIAEVFALQLKDGKIHSSIVPGLSKVRLKAIVRGALDETTLPASYRAHDALTDFGFKTFLSLRSEMTENGTTKIAPPAIEAFLSFAKRRLQKFNGVPAHTFYLHLKESEFRFNLGEDDLAQMLLRMLREAPLELSLDHMRGGTLSGGASELLAA